MRRGGGGLASLLAGRGGMSSFDPIERIVSVYENGSLKQQHEEKRIDLSPTTIDVIRQLSGDSKITIGSSGWISGSNTYYAAFSHNGDPEDVTYEIEVLCSWSRPADSPRRGNARRGPDMPRGGKRCGHPDQQ